MLTLAMDDCKHAMHVFRYKATSKLKPATATSPQCMQENVRSAFRFQTYCGIGVQDDDPLKVTHTESMQWCIEEPHTEGYSH